MTAAFYDQLAPYYHLLYGDWESSIATQGAALATMLHKAGVLPGDQVLDAASGIGTQTLGLLERGYRVTASDISPGAIERLKVELSRRSLQATAFVDDLRTLSHTPSESMAAVLACDNSIPHILSDGELLQAFRSCYRCLRPGGIAAFSVRDYAAIERINPDVRPYGLRREAGNRFLAVQVWEWDNDQYDLRVYLTSESAEGICETRVLRSRYYAVSIERLLLLLAEAGFVCAERRDDILFQPVLLARRPNTV
ncbi:class I SAM-dependent DNA methyltransferase [Rhodoferax sp.]|jgi:SAM-dependent methyltransferase|uniref:class I SAM-dependent DNA methyltransferase n=1 Tax=Rhodoferax sp. TaxID=50421 RepID=UPI0037830610